MTFRLCEPDDPEIEPYPSLFGTPDPMMYDRLPQTKTQTKRDF
jgi:hypothetical protein